MVTTSSLPRYTRASAPRKRLFALLTLLLLLSLVAVYTWTLPLRKERALRAASFTQLVAISKREPNNPRVFYHMGLRLQSLGQLPPARAAFERAADLAPDDADAWLAWAAAAGNLGNEQEAFGVLSAFTRRHPNSAPAHKALATFYYAEDAMPRAYDEAMAAARLAPKDGAAWRLAGSAAMEFDAFPKAEDAFRQAAQVDPRNWRSFVGLGDALDHEDRKPDALDCYRKASALAPNEPTPTFALGRMMLVQANAPAEI